MIPLIARERNVEETARKLNPNFAELVGRVGFLNVFAFCALEKPNGVMQLNQGFIIVVMTSYDAYR